jgi:peptide/nickel transport system substrate-binding protein
VRQHCVRERPWSAPLYVWLWRLRLLFLVLLGCTLADNTPVGAAEQPSKGGTIVWAVHEGMPDFDIHYQGTYIAAQPIGPIYNGLLTFDVYDNEKIVGDLAERWEITEDGKQITFALRKGVKFHDGSDFTCADAKYSFEKLTDPKRATPLFVTIMENAFAGATCPDDFTLVLSLKEPSAVMLTVLAGAHAVMMKAGIAEQVDRKDPKFLIGTGPFKYKSHTPGVDFRAERNPNYWKPGLPHIDGYQAFVMSDMAPFKFQLTVSRKPLVMLGW